MPDIITCGEMLIDFVATAKGVTLIEAPAFEKAAGGAPANVAVGLARFGLSSGFLGKVGDDDFGRYLQLVLDENGVDTTNLSFSAEARTALAFVSLRVNGDRDFMFYRHPSADMLFTPGDVDPAYIVSAKVFHFGSITLGAQPSQAATLYAVDIARANGLFISYDPNLRMNLWPSAEAAREGIMLGWPHANLIKVSQEELEFLTGTDDLEKAARKLWHDNLRLLVVTQGREGSAYVFRVQSPKSKVQGVRPTTFDFGPWTLDLHVGHVPGFRMDAIDTTGAGDAFVAGLLYKLYPRLGQPLQEADIREAARFANAAGALTTTKRGAIPALPTLEEVEALLSE